MINSFGVNTQTPFYGADYAKDPERYAFLQSELSAVDSVAKIYDGTVITDNYYGKLPFASRVGSPRIKYLSTKSEIKSLTVVRKYIYTHQFADNSSEEESLSMLNSFRHNVYDLVYNNEEVKAYLPRE